MSDVLPTPITSSDTLRSDRLPPHQVLTRKWPVLHEGAPPRFDPATWEFRVDGLVDEPWQATWEQFRALPTVHVKADMHCVTRWSRLDMVWQGVATREVIQHVRVRPEAAAVMVHCDGGYTTNLPFEAFLDEDCLFAWGADGEPLSADHGGPLRLVIPKLYAWKSAKWVRRIELRQHDAPGFWERGGYHMLGDPWREQRYG
jgi:DMSO/TMAO reductase YedYZ molybdopterin-dependent catalytic subunit